MSTTHDTGPARADVEQNAPADLLDRAEAFRAELGDDDVAELRDALAAAERALDEQRPAPDPRWLGHQLKLVWFRGRRRVGADDSTDRWTATAETAIDAVRGLWPVTTPTNVAEGGESAAGSPPATGAPALGDTHALTPLAEVVDREVLGLARVMCGHDDASTEWDDVRPALREFYLSRSAAALTHLVEHGWRPADLAARSGS